jgi:hypothetical protein
MDKLSDGCPRSAQAGIAQKRTTRTESKADERTTGIGNLFGLAGLGGSFSSGVSIWSFAHTLLESQTFTWTYADHILLRSILDDTRPAVLADSNDSVLVVLFWAIPAWADLGQPSDSLSMMLLITLFSSGPSYFSSLHPVSPYVLRTSIFKTMKNSCSYSR